MPRWTARRRYSLSASVVAAVDPELLLADALGDARWHSRPRRRRRRRSPGGRNRAAPRDESSAALTACLRSLGVGLGRLRDAGDLGGLAVEPSGADLGLDRRPARRTTYSPARTVADATFTWASSRSRGRRPGRRGAWVSSEQRREDDVLGRRGLVRCGGRVAACATAARPTDALVARARNRELGGELLDLALVRHARVGGGLADLGHGGRRGHAGGGGLRGRRRPRRRRCCVDAPDWARSASPTLGDGRELGGGLNGSRSAAWACSLLCRRWRCFGRGVAVASFAGRLDRSMLLGVATGDHDAVRRPGSARDCSSRPRPGATRAAASTSAAGDGPPVSCPAAPTASRR